MPKTAQKNASWKTKKRFPLSHWPDDDSGMFA
jgi:hypothetical protein